MQSWLLKINAKLGRLKEWEEGVSTKFGGAVRLEKNLLASRVQALSKMITDWLWWFMRKKYHIQKKSGSDFCLLLLVAWKTRSLGRLQHSLSIPLHPERSIASESFVAELVVKHERLIIHIAIEGEVPSHAWWNLNLLGLGDYFHI